MRKLFYQILLILLLPALSWAQSITDLVAQGDKFYGKKDYKKSLELYLSALEPIAVF